MKSRAVSPRYSSCRTRIIRADSGPLEYAGRNERTRSLALSFLGLVCLSTCYLVFRGLVGPRCKWHEARCPSSPDVTPPPIRRTRTRPPSTALSMPCRIANCKVVSTAMYSRQKNQMDRWTEHVSQMQTSRRANCKPRFSPCIHATLAALKFCGQLYIYKKSSVGARTHYGV